MEREEVITISSPVDLPHGWHKAYIVKDEHEAAQIAAGRKSYLYQSHIIAALYLFVPVEDV